MTQKAAELAMRERLAGLSGLPTIVWPNVTAPDTRPRVEVTFFNANPERLTIDGRHRHRSIMQVAIVTDLGDGTDDATTRAEAIAAHFPRDLRLDGWVRVYQRPSVSEGLIVEGAWHTPVSVPFEFVTL